MKIGDPIWIHQYNASRIERERWVKHIIIGETTRSWLVISEGTYTSEFAKNTAKFLDPKDYYHRFVIKVAKTIKPGAWVGVCMSDLAVDDMCWLHDHRAHIERQIGVVNNVTVMRKIAALIGYNEITHGSHIPNENYEN